MDRSLTPPLDPKFFEAKLKENGKFGIKPSLGISLYDDEDQMEITKDTPIIKTVETLYGPSTPIRTPKQRFDFFFFQFKMKNIQNSNFFWLHIAYHTKTQ